MMTEGGMVTHIREAVQEVIPMEGAMIGREEMMIEGEGKKGEEVTVEIGKEKKKEKENKKESVNVMKKKLGTKM